MVSQITLHLSHLNFLTQTFFTVGLCKVSLVIFSLPFLSFESDVSVSSGSTLRGGVYSMVALLSTLSLVVLTSSSFQVYFWQFLKPGRVWFGGSGIYLLHFATM